MAVCLPSPIQEKTTYTISTPVADPIDEWLEEDLWGFRKWHVMFMFGSGFLAVVICICCCCRFRIPRTKQEIEADYVRKKLTRKFRRQLRLLQNSEMDEMDLKRALDRIRAEFKSDTESLAQSDAYSVGSFTRSRPGSPLHYRKASEIDFQTDSVMKGKKEGWLRSKYSRFLNVSWF